ncbi:hypothetical protein Cgig2_016140 [Carnegiea gigantea]|uniref:Uncharacterized protein n=1 Tax=Carnegiea gigantea TaxID=171969 RepID=A0A9Q1KPQ9_9CARY|nr:hypothetical protein Cgig2_016140 [Carnegiea gigantea]
MPLLLGMASVEIRLVWENLDINSTTCEVLIKDFVKDLGAEQTNFRETASNSKLEVQENMGLLEGFANKDVMGIGLSVKGYYSERFGFWMRLVGPAEAKRFCDAFQKIYHKLVHEELSREAIEILLLRHHDGSGCSKVYLVVATELRKPCQAKLVVHDNKAPKNQQRQISTQYDVM